MPRYFFEVHDDEAVRIDDVGLELEDRVAAGRAAILKLRGVGGPGPPKQDVRRTFAIFVTDEQRQPVLKAVLNYAFKWLD